MLSPILSDFAIGEALGVGLTVEFIRDSPQFLQQVAAFEESFSGFAPYCNGLLTSLECYAQALTALHSAQIKLKDALTGGRDNNRCLFTNAVPNLGELSDTLAATSTFLDAQACGIEQLSKDVSQLLPVLHNLAASSDLTAERARMRIVERNRAAYESKLLSFLKVRRKYTEAEVSQIVELRSIFELGRFDMCRRLNVMDSNKKVVLTKFACRLSEHLRDSHESVSKGMAAGTGTAHEILASRREALPAVEATAVQCQRLWEGIRDRLRGELVGALPPPGAPLGALSPGHGPVGHVGCNLFSVSLETEVLSSGSRAAKKLSSQQPRDQGIHKQGHLITESRYLGARARRWFRLYGTTLYKVIPPDQSGEPTCEMRTVCDVFGATVSAKPGPVAHKFALQTRTGDNFEFQAENDNEAMLWIWALRRCANGGVSESKRVQGSSSQRDSALDFRMSRIDTNRDADSWLVHGGAGGAAVPAVLADLLASSVAEEEPDGDESVSSDVRSTASGISTYASARSRAKSEFADCEIVFGEKHSDLASLARAQNHGPPSIRPGFVRAGPCATRVEMFLERNAYCAECSARCPPWISVNLGVSLCDDCATVHARLGWNVSKLRNVRLDDMSSWQCDLILQEIGNAKAQMILEASIPAGWTKPTPESSPEDKAQWINAKYRWYAFVSDGGGSHPDWNAHTSDDDLASTDESMATEGIRDPAALQRGLIAAVKKGSVLGAMWWLAHRADVNAILPSTGSAVSRTPLHEAIMRGHVSTVAYLCLNGADIYQPDSAGSTPLQYLDEVGTENVLPAADRRTMQTILLNVLRADC